MTRESLAQLIGVQHNAISIVAHVLLQGRNYPLQPALHRYANGDGLRQMACECYGAVKAHHQRLLNAPH